MDEKKLLSYLKIEHLQDNEGLKEIAETSGLEIVKLLLLNHEGLKLYIPKIKSLSLLVEDYITDNYQNLNRRSLQNVLGVSNQTILNYLNKIPK